MDKMELFSKLPIELQNCILEYDGRVSIRRGVPIMKIQKDDIRYQVLNKIPKIKENVIYVYNISYGCKYIVWFSNRSQLMYCKTFCRKKQIDEYSYVLRMRNRRNHPDDDKYKISITTKI